MDARRRPMDSTLKLAAGGLTLALGLGGCGGGAGGEPVVQAGDPAAVDASITQSLDRLRALDIVHVGRLVLDLPEQATACYGLPCPGSEWVEKYEAERARQA